MSARLKVLFVTHTVAPTGGAARSLRELVNAWDVDADLMMPAFNGAADDASVRAFFGPRVRRLFRRWLAYDMCYRGQPPVWQSARRHLLFPLMWRADRGRFYRFLERERYDVVHLNTIVLHPLVRADLPFIMHVRDILNPNEPEVLASAVRARGVVFIDEATRAPFVGEPLRASIVLNNPVDMRSVGRLPAEAAARLGGDPAKLTIFSMIGLLNPEKGVDVVIDAMRGVASPDVRLLLVGSGQSAFTARLQRQAAGDRRIVFWGTESDIANIYTLSDWVVRGEAYHCVGRTIYEGLYAGCGVIVPGDPASHSFFEYERFADRIRMYRPGDRTELSRTFEALVGHKLANKQGGSNVAAYTEQFDRFIRGALAMPPPPR
jgi:glycosyltransferase involved in cell wall biosynthesis